MSKGDRKADYFVKVKKLFREYNKVFVVGIDNVGSSQMHQIRQALRAEAVLLMGKNTLVKKAMREIIDEIPEIENLMPCIVGNVGLVFTGSDLGLVRNLIVKNKVAAPAKIGAISQCDVTIPAGPTGISPDKTGFFQALGISTKVVKGAIEILTPVKILSTGSRVGASEAELLGMLNIMPFFYGCVVQLVYDNGSVFEPAMLDITATEVMKYHQAALQNIAAISLELGYPTIAAVPHVLVRAYKNLLAGSIASDYDFPEAQKLKAVLVA